MNSKKLDQNHEQREISHRLTGQLVPQEPVEVALEPGERLDIFLGTSGDWTKVKAQDPRAFSIINLKDTERNEEGAILYEGRLLSPHLQYLMIQPGVPIDWKTGKGYKGLRQGEVVDMGRTQERVKDRFVFSDLVSRNHFTVAVDDEAKLMVMDNGSTNGTSYRTTAEVPASTADPEEERRQAYYRELFRLPDPQGKDRFGNDLDRRLKVTEQSQADAAMAYRFSDQDIKAIVGPYAREHHGVWREEDMAKVLRDDPELRVQLGVYLLEKLETVGPLPKRFYGSATKNPNYVGYRNMTSREYAALLALSMLDGTFKNPSGSDPIESKYGDIIRGQHRYAAMRILGIDTRAGIKEV